MAEQHQTAVQEQPKAAEQKTEQKTRPKSRADDNTVFVGKKPTMSYVLALMTQLSVNKEVNVRARGRSISTAVDVVEAVKNKFLRDITPAVTIGTEQITDQSGKRLNVSTIDIVVRKK